jgi:hypothetical protein
MVDTVKLAATIRQAEGFTATPIPDIGGVEVGYGRNLNTDPLTKDEAEYLLQGPMMQRISALQNSLPWFNAMDDVRSRALCEMAYQMGSAGVLSFRQLLGCCAVKDWPGASRNVLETSAGTPTPLALQTPSRAHRYAQMLLTGVDVPLGVG